MASVNTRTGKAITVWRGSGTRKTPALRLIERIVTRLWADKTRSAAGELVGIEAWNDLGPLRDSLLLQDLACRQNHGLT